MKGWVIASTTLRAVIFFQSRMSLEYRGRKRMKFSRLHGLSISVTAFVGLTGNVAFAAAALGARDADCWSPSPITVTQEVERAFISDEHLAFAIGLHVVPGSGAYKQKLSYRLYQSNGIELYRGEFENDLATTPGLTEIVLPISALHASPGELKPVMPGAREAIVSFELLDDSGCRVQRSAGLFHLYFAGRS
jgi:hypothetical protein